MNVPAEVALLAHQGGWDEILMVLAPLAIFGGLLMLANRRADKLGDHDESESIGDESPTND